MKLSLHPRPLILRNFRQVVQKRKMEIDNILTQIRSDIQEIKKTVSIPSSASLVSEKWISRQEVMSFLNYGSTQMAEFEKSGDIVVTTIGKRKFILKESLEKLLNKNIIK